MLCPVSGSCITATPTPHLPIFSSKSSEIWMRRLGGEQSSTSTSKPQPPSISPDLRFSSSSSSSVGRRSSINQPITSEESSQFPLAALIAPLVIVLCLALVALALLVILVLWCGCHIRRLHKRLPRPGSGPDPGPNPARPLAPPAVYPLAAPAVTPLEPSPALDHKRNNVSSGASSEFSSFLSHSSENESESGRSGPVENPVLLQQELNTPLLQPEPQNKGPLPLRPLASQFIPGAPSNQLHPNIISEYEYAVENEEHQYQPFNNSTSADIPSYTHAAEFNAGSTHASVNNTGSAVRASSIVSVQLLNGGFNSSSYTNESISSGSRPFPMAVC